MHIRPGKDTAIRVPLHECNRTGTFHGDKLGLTKRRALANRIGFAGDEMVRPIGRVPAQSQTDMRLERLSDAPDRAPRHLESRCPDPSKPPGTVQARRTSDPAGPVLLLRRG